MTVTFRVSPNEPAIVYRSERPRNLIEWLPEYRNQCDSLLQGTSVDLDAFQPCRNGFVNTVVACYNSHHNLVIRPDDVWLAIVSQFAFYVNGNAEELRHMFVQHEGQEELEVIDLATLRTADYDRLSVMMAAKLRERLKNAADPHVADWILPSFSTTTDNDIITGAVLLMGTMKSYFSYKMSLLCGVPYVTLEGSTQDWEDIRSRIQKLKLYPGHCGPWSNMLTKVVDQFIAASNGSEDIDFWQQICHHHSAGSGTTYLSGWITAFCVFSIEGEWQGGVTRVQTFLGTIEYLEFPVIDSEDVPAGYVTVDVTVNDSGVEHKTMMFAGHVGSQIVDDTTLAPQLAWAICLAKPSKLLSDMWNPLEADLSLWPL